MCIIQALVDNPQCPKCSSWVLCEIHDGKAALTWSPNSQPPPRPILQLQPLNLSTSSMTAQLDTTAEEDSQESSVPKDNNNSEIEEPERDGLAWDEVGI